MIKDAMLSDVVWLDEKLMPVNKRHLLAKANGLKYRGQSMDQIVVACAIVNNGNKYAEIVGRGHVSSQGIQETHAAHQRFPREAERNMVVHMGSRSENLQDYLNWIVFRLTINADNIDGKVTQLESKCFQSKVTYRIKDRYNLKK